MASARADRRTGMIAMPREESPSHARRTTASPRLRGSPAARTRRRPPRYGFARDAIVPRQGAGLVLSLWDQPTSQLCSGDGAQPRAWALLAADRVASKRTRAWKRKRRPGAEKPCRCGRAAAGVAAPEGPSFLSIIHSCIRPAAEDRTSPRPSVSLTEVRAADLPEPAECLRAAGSHRGPQALPGSRALRPATPTVLVGDLAAAGRLAQRNPHQRWHRTSASPRSRSSGASPAAR
jgi:hypothetical protein